MHQRGGAPFSDETNVDLAIAEPDKVVRDDVRTQVDATVGKLGLGFPRIADRIVAMVGEATSAAVRNNTDSDSEAVFAAASDARLTFGLFAPWGAGKSTLIRELQKRFRTEGHLIFTINPWKWDGKTDIHDHVTAQVLAQFADQRLGYEVAVFKLARCWEQYKAWISTALVLACFTYWVPWDKVGAAVANITAEPEKVASGVSLAIVGLFGIGVFTPVVAMLAPKLLGWAWSQIVALLNRETNAERQKRLGADGLSQAYRDISALLYNSGGIKKPFIFFFDDLDRCAPERVASVLDSVHSLTAAGCVVFLAFDEEYIVAAINAHYEKIAQAYTDTNFGQRFLEKIVQISFRLPLVKREDIFNLDLASPPATATLLDSPEPGAPNASNAALPAGGSGVAPGTGPAIPEVKLREIIGEILDKTVEPLGLNIRQVKALSNTLKLYLGIQDIRSETEAKRVCAFIFADRFDPRWLDSLYNDTGSLEPPIGANPKLAALLSDFIGNDKDRMLRMYHLVGRRPRPSKPPAPLPPAASALPARTAEPKV